MNGCESAGEMTTTKHGLAEVNGAQIYYEIRGSGPPLLLIMGLTGDAGWFEPLAELLAKQFTVVTYDRRANSRSPRPEGWTSTSIAEQADDAAGLLSALRLSPAIVFGNSFGAMILLELVVRHPRRALPGEPGQEAHDLRLVERRLVPLRRDVAQICLGDGQMRRGAQTLDQAPHDQANDVVGIHQSYGRDGENA